MSVRAYRVIKIEVTKQPTFNLWHDEALVDFLDSKMDILNAINDGASGIVGIEVELLERALTEVPNLPDDIKTALTKDIAFARENNDEFVDYIFY